MANIPTVAQLYAAIIADLEAELSITISPFGRSYLRARAMVQAARIWLLYLQIGNVQKNIFVDTAEEDVVIRFGLVKLGRLPFPATQGQYLVQVIGTTGAVIPASTQFKSNDDSLSPGRLFVLDADFVLNGINQITLRALDPGSVSRLNAYDQLTPTAPIALVNSIGIVISETIEPQAAENIEDYRQKVIDAFRLEPQGGAAADYRLWSNEVQGVVQSYPYAAPGLTYEVNLYIESDEPDGVPSVQDLQNVQDNIELPTADRPARKPITVIVNYLPVTPRSIDIEITGFVGIDSGIATLIYAAIESRLAEIRPFVDSIDVLADRNDYFDINSIISIILEARPGSVFGAVTMDVDTVPMTSITFTNGDIPDLNIISYV